MKPNLVNKASSKQKKKTNDIYNILPRSTYFSHDTVDACGCYFTEATYNAVKVTQGISFFGLDTTMQSISILPFPFL
jgi:hypothetical protein